MARKKTSKRITTTLRGKTPEYQKKPASKELLAAFSACTDSNWEDSKLYEKYSSLIDEHLGDKKDDKLERAGLTVGLARIKLGSLRLDWSTID